MASFPSYANIPITVQKEWYKIRDMFFGHNFVRQDIQKALELARVCTHPDAEWLVAVCTEAHVTNADEAVKAFQLLSQTDARACAFAATMDSFNGMLWMERSATFGFAYAKAQMCIRSQTRKQSFEYAYSAVLQHERDGFFELGKHWLYGNGCEKNLTIAKELFSVAADLGHIFSVYRYCSLLDDNDLEKWQLLSNATLNGSMLDFSKNFSKQVDLWKENKRSDAIMFVIGRTLHRLRLDNRDTEETLTMNAERAIDFYKEQIKASQQAVHAWTQVGRRLRVCRDIRKVIGQLIWNMRDEAVYEVFV